MDSPDLDMIAIGTSSLLLASYYLFLLYRHRRNPDFTIHSVNHRARALWVSDVMKSQGKKDVMAVQTLRNIAMAATFKASSAILLILGTLTLSGQAENLARTWHVFNIGGSQAAEWWTVKILFLLTVLIVAFFAFSMVVRLLNHIVFMVNLSQADAHGALSPQRIAQRLNRAGVLYSVGMRAFFIAVPLAFWLFGPFFLLASTVGLIIVLYFLDRSPFAENV